MTLTRLNHALHIESALQALGTESSGTKIMAKKARIFYFAVEGLSFVAMNILKQEALSVGGDYATPRGAITHSGEQRGILIATHSQLERIVAKLRIQPFGLKELAAQLATHLDSLKHAPNEVRPELMAIVNVTPDSFYAPSRCDTSESIARIEALLNKSIPLIDIGAASSRPGSELIESNEEIARLRELCAHIKAHRFYERARFSIDTYNPKTAAFALEHGFSLINDVSGLSDEEMPKVAARYNAGVVLMHAKGTPKDMQTLTQYENLIGEVDAFFTRKIALLRAAGVEEIILDIGFGFAKTSEQNLSLIRHLEHFLHFGFPLLIGASRKSTIGELTGREAEGRLSGTLALHLLALQNGASILRVHDEDPHIDMLKIYEALR